MAYRKRTLRSMSPVARKLARLAGEAGSLERRLKGLVAEIQQLELDSLALAHSRHTLEPQVDEPVFGTDPRD